MNKKTRLYNWDDFEYDIHKCLEFFEKQKYAPDAIIGLARGGLVPAIKLSHKLNKPMISHNLSLYDKKEDQDNSVFDAVYQQLKKLKIPNPQALIIDDINDTGKTLNLIKEDAKIFAKVFNYDANSIFKYVTLWSRPTSKFKDLYYSPRICIDKSWIVFPWE